MARKKYTKVKLGGMVEEVVANKLERLRRKANRKVKLNKSLALEMLLRKAMDMPMTKELRNKGLAALIR